MMLLSSQACPCLACCSAACHAQHMLQPYCRYTLVTLYAICMVQQHVTSQALCCLPLPLG